MVHSNHSSASSHGSLSGFPEEDLRVGGKRNVGYFPAWLGQTFLGGKYVVVRKLGWGQYSSVWLARDKEFVIGITTVHTRTDPSWSRLDRYTALKLLTVEATSAMNAKELDEEGILQHIAKSRKEVYHPGAAHVLSLFDTFRFMGPLGEHLCLVTEVLGFDLNFFRKAQPNSQVSIPIVKRIVRQILLGLDFLHV
jgi:serine/threonine-protein kinase SRPK3